MQILSDARVLLYNAKKTQVIKFSCCKSDEVVDLSFCGDTLQLSKTVVHLGHILSSDLCDDTDIMSQRKDLCKKANCMLSVVIL